MGLSALFLAASLVSGDVIAQPGVTADGTVPVAVERLTKGAISFDWKTRKAPVAFLVVTEDGVMDPDLVRILHDTGFTLYSGKPAEFPMDARALVSRGTQAVLMHHDGLHAKAVTPPVEAAAFKKTAMMYFLENRRRRNDRVILRIRHNLKVVGMLESSKSSVEKALHELSDFAQSEELPRLNEVSKQVYTQRQRVLAELRVTSSGDPGLRTVVVPSDVSGSATIEIPEVTMESLRTTVMVPSK